MDSAQANPQRVPLRRPAFPPAVLGMLIFITCEVMLFGGMLSGFTIVRSNAMIGRWPPPGQPLLPVEQTMINSTALLLSGVLGFFALRQLRRHARGAGWLLGVTWLLGAAFVALQGVEWVTLLGQGMTLRSSQLGAFFYLLVGSHGLHALAALVALGVAALRLRRGTLTHESLLSTLIFWWFVVGMWPVIYGRVYF